MVIVKSFSNKSIPKSIGDMDFNKIEMEVTEEAGANSNTVMDLPSIIEDVSNSFEEFTKLLTMIQTNLDEDELKKFGTKSSSLTTI